VASKDRRERERAQQRQNILDAALEIITKEGFAALSMRKIAERIEYSAASIYLYFASREQIAQALSEQGFQEFLEAISLAVSGKQVQDALHSLSAAYLEFGRRHPEIYRLIFMGDSEYMTAAYAEQQSGSAAAKAFEVLLGLARQLKADEAAKSEMTPPMMAEMIWCTLHGIVSLHITCAAFLSTSPEVLASFAVATLARGLLASPREK
jgi:AcrR family transcriptional regulator